VKIKLDENVPFELVAELRGGGHDVDTVADEGLTGRPVSQPRSLTKTSRRGLTRLWW
jgi:hypothetical protein